jgi:hypothetical protein
MPEEDAADTTEETTADPAAEVVAEALDAIQQDEKAAPVAAALKSAWDGTRFDVDGAVHAIAHDTLSTPPS